MRKLIVLHLVAALVFMATAVGGVYALWTQDLRPNFAYSTGNMKVFAALSIVEAWSDDVVHEVQNGNHVTFSNANTADLDLNLVTVDRFTPMDGIRLALSVENQSTIAIKYRVSLSAVSDEISAEEAALLLQALEITLDGQALEQGFGQTEVGVLTLGQQVSQAAHELVIFMPQSVEGQQYMNIGFSLRVHLVATQADSVPA